MFNVPISGRNLKRPRQASTGKGTMTASLRSSSSSTKLGIAATKLRQVAKSAKIPNLRPQKRAKGNENAIASPGALSEGNKSLSDMSLGSSDAESAKNLKCPRKEATGNDTTTPSLLSSSSSTKLRIAAGKLAKLVKSAKIPNLRPQKRAKGNENAIASPGTLSEGNESFSDMSLGSCDAESAKNLICPRKEATGNDTTTPSLLSSSSSTKLRIAAGKLAKLVKSAKIPIFRPQKGAKGTEKAMASPGTSSKRKTSLGNRSIGTTEDESSDATTDDEEADPTYGAATTDDEEADSMYGYAKQDASMSEQEVDPAMAMDTDPLLAGSSSGTNGGAETEKPRIPRPPMPLRKGPDDRPAPNRSDKKRFQKLESQTRKRMKNVLKYADRFMTPWELQDKPDVSKPEPKQKEKTPKNPEAPTEPDGMTQQPSTLLKVSKPERKENEKVKKISDLVEEVRKEHPQPQVYSAIFQTPSKKPILFYLGTRKNTKTKPVVKQMSEQYEGRTELDPDAASKCIEDGIFEKTMLRYWIAVQVLCSLLTAHKDEDPRHRKEDGENFTYQDRFGNTVEERRGFFHFVQAWAMSGHHKGLYPSQDLCRSSTAFAAVRSYYEASRSLAAQLSAMVQVLMPKVYKKYKKAFDAGAIYPESDPGPFLGRAVLWKLQLEPHLDSGDVGPSISFAYGAFSGGHIEIPELGARFLYKAGDVLLFYSSQLWHTVSTWVEKDPEANPKTSGYGLTPGRGSSVFFNPQKTMKLLKGKPKGWALRTSCGHGLDTSYD